MKYLAISALILSFTIGNANATPQSKPLPPFKSCEKAVGYQMYTTTDNWIIIGNELHTTFPELDRTVPDIVSLSKILKSQGTTLVPIIIPLRPMVVSSAKSPGSKQMENYNRDTAIQSYKDVIKKMNGLGIPTVDLVDVLKNKNPDVFFRNDHHITPEGSILIAQAISRKIKTLPVYKSIPRIDFSTAFVKQETFREPSFTIAPFCGEQPKEVFNIYKTTALNAQDDLLNDDLPQIEYVGTSMGRDSWNIIGNLQQQLKADVGDQHIEAAGGWLSMLNYFQSKEYAEHKPKILIWEFSLYETYMDRDGALPFTQPEAIQQIVAASQAPCTESSILAKTSSTEPLEDISLEKSLDLMPNDYLHFKFSNLSVKNISMDFLDKNDHKVSAKLEIPDRLMQRGQAFFMIPKQIDSLKRLRIQLPSESKSLLEVEVCRSNYR